jgi:histidine triad (HIT) family protein
MDDCIFCRIAAGSIPSTKIYEDEVVLAFLDIAPVSDGHVLVVPKQHFEYIHDCPADLLGSVCSRIGKIAGAVQRAVDADGYNVLCNNGRAAGQVVGHLHFHIIPRKSGDGVFDKWPSFQYPPAKAERIARLIRDLL